MFTPPISIFLPKGMIATLEQKKNLLQLYKRLKKQSELLELHPLEMPLPLPQQEVFILFPKPSSLTPETLVSLEALQFVMQRPKGKKSSSVEADVLPLNGLEMITFQEFGKHAFQMRESIPLNSSGSTGGELSEHAPPITGIMLAWIMSAKSVKKPLREKKKSFIHSKSQIIS